MAKNDLRIEALGTSITIAADEDAVYLAELLSRYLSTVEKTKKNTGLRDPLKIAILTGFLLCDELHKLRKKDSMEQSMRTTESREAEEIASSMTARLDEVLGYVG